MTKDEFLSLVDKSNLNECHNFLGTLNNCGYGRASYNGRQDGAHRIIWEIEVGEIPKGKLVLHKCDNKRCCNVNHLYIGDYFDNAYDSVLRNPIPPEILAFGKASLHEGEIWLIRKLKVIIGYKPTCRDPIYKFSSGKVAKMFKVSQRTILRVWNNSKVLCREGYYV